MSNFRQRSRLAAAAAGLTLGIGWSIDVDGDGTADPSGPVDGRRKNYREKAGGMDMSKHDRSGVFHFEEAHRSIPGPDGERAITVFRHGTLHVKLSARPLRPNRQTPHVQDEVYVVISGRGVLFHDGKRESFEAGDCLFVAAGTEHHFEDFSEDLSVWVIFYGPSGGELPERSEFPGRLKAG